MTHLERPQDGLTVRQVAERLGVHQNTVFSWIKSGFLPATRFGRGRGKLLIHPDDLERVQQPARPAAEPPGE